MFRKTSIVMFMLSMIWLLGIPSFAEDTILEEQIFTDREVAEAIEIIAPEMNADDNVSIEKDNLYINIRLNQPVEVYFSLYKVDSISLDESKKALDDDVDLEKESTIIVVDDEDDQEQGIPEVLSENDKTTYRKAIIELYKEAGKNLETQQLALDAHLEFMEETFGGLPFDSEEALLSDEQKELLASYEVLEDGLEASQEALNSIERQYKQLFEKLVYGPEEVKVSAIIPQYTNEIKDVDPGQYKMVFYRDVEVQKAIKVMYFNIETSEETIEKIVDTIPQDLERIWDINPE